MPSYVCMIYGKDDQVITVEGFDRPVDAAAVTEAEAIATSNVGCRGYELWKGGKKIATSLPKAGQPSAHERFPNK